jgi:Tetratricopeptide repeat.
MGQYEKAIPDYEAALKLNPQDNDTFSRLQWTQGQLKAKNAPPPTTTTTNNSGAHGNSRKTESD